MSACPTSWLRMERYALDELRGDELQDVEGHLASCAACSELLAGIRADTRPLPPLPAVEIPTPWWKQIDLRWLLAPAALAVGALLVLRLPAPGLPAAEIQVKGGTLAVELVRERGGALSTDPRSYTPGDRIQVRTTCPPGAAVEVVVFEAGRPSFPLPTPACGNGVVAGAIRLTGSGPVAICVVEDRPRNSIAGLEDLGAAAACVDLKAD